MLYDAFGNTLSRTGTTPTPFGFVGASQYQSDINSGLQLLGHRYYDPSIGRFLSSDPAQAGTNWYAYCDNCPLSGTDATGLDKIDDKRNKIDDGIKKKYGDLPTGRTYTTEKEAIQAGSDYTGTLTQGTGVEWGVVVTHYKTAGGVDKYQLVHLTRGIARSHRNYYTPRCHQYYTCSSQTWASLRRGVFARRSTFLRCEWYSYYRWNTKRPYTSVDATPQGTEMRVN